MDYQNRVGSKFGGGGVAGKSETNAARRERLRKLASEHIDLARDPYFFRNHLGKYECRLCMTVHANDGSYLVHTQGRKHQQNLARRAARDRQQQANYADPGAVIDPLTGLPVPESNSQALILRAGGAAAADREVLRIGRPGYKAQKIRDPATGRQGLLFQVSYPEFDHRRAAATATGGVGSGAAVGGAGGARPRHRFVSAYEQRVEQPPDGRFQYLVLSADPYDLIAFKLPAREIDRSTEAACWDHWDHPTYTVQFFWA